MSEGAVQAAVPPMALSSRDPAAAPEPARPIRILYVTSNADDVGGADFCLLRIASEMQASGHSVRVLARRANRLAGDFAAAGVAVTVRPFFRPTKKGGPVALAANAVRALGAIAWFVSFFRRERPDIVHVNDLIDLIPAIAAKLAGRHVVYNLRTITGGVAQRRLMSWLISASSDVAVCASSAVQKHYFLEHQRGRHRSAVIHDWVDPVFLEAPRPEECPEAFRGVRLRVVMVGRITRWKGQGVFIAAARSLRGRFPDAGFFLVGGFSSEPADAEYVQRVKEQAADAGVVLLGERPDIASLLRWADVSVHASTAPDPLPGTVMESIARGAATIGADAGGVPDMIIDGSTGLLTPPGDAPALAQAVASLLESPDLRKRLAAAGREHAERRFSREVLAQRFRDTYRDCLGHRARSCASRPDRINVPPADQPAPRWPGVESHGS